MKSARVLLSTLIGCGGASLAPPDTVPGGADAAASVDSGAEAPDAAPTDLGALPADTGVVEDAAVDSGVVDAGSPPPLCEEPCRNGQSCGRPEDCQSGRCLDGVCVSPEGTHPDIVRVVTVVGRNPGGRGWADSYSVLDKCYCATTYDHGIGVLEVETPVGTRTVRQVCEALGAGPGIGQGDEARPIYNDVQCGNGPPNDAGDEDDCPGRVDIGRDGCGHIGPRWDLSGLR